MYMYMFVYVLLKGLCLSWLFEQVIILVAVCHMNIVLREADLTARPTVRPGYGLAAIVLLFQYLKLLTDTGDLESGVRPHTHVFWKLIEAFVQVTI